MQIESPVNILLVDDQSENLVALEAILGELGANLVKSTSGEEALRCLLYDDFAVILLDVQMPQMDGFEVATLIRQRQRSRDTPIIFLTAFNSSEQFMFKGYALGAVDYLIKPISPSILLSKVTIFIELFKKTAALRQKTEILQQQTEALKRQAAQLEAMNAELQISEERFRLLSTCSPVGVFVTDTEGYCVYTNPRFQAICDFAITATSEQNWLAAVHPDDLEFVRSTWSEYLQAGQEYSQECRFQTKDATMRWVLIRSARLISEVEHFLGYVGTVEDITERKQAEAVNAQIIREQAARQEAETANRMKDEFIAILSHELRTPLNSILGWSRLLKSCNLNPQKIAYGIDTIERNATAQAKLIEDILDVSQIVRGKLQLQLQPLNLIAVTQAALETVRPVAEAKAVTLVANLPNGPHLEVMGDLLRLQQVIWNLLANAIKFTPPEGRVEITVSVITGHSSTGNIHSSLVTDYWSSISTKGQMTNYAQIQVIDSGIGIDSDFLPHVFDRFRQADSSTTRPQNGLGLGLAIVHHLVEQHQGFVWAESPGLNQGATFTVALPLLPSTAPTTIASGQTNSFIENQTEALAGMSILIVDDDGDNRDFLAFLLQSQGAVVTTAASGEEALQLMFSVHPAVLLCDISMPDMDGYTLMEKLKTQLLSSHAQVSAIAITAHARVSDQVQALTAGFQCHLPKPIEPEVLVRTILQITGSTVHQH